MASAFSISSSTIAAEIPKVLMFKEVEKGKYEQMLRGLMDTDEDELKNLYNAREIEPEQADEDWTPEDKTFL